MITTYSCIGMPTIETGSGSDNASKPVHNITIEIRSRSSLYRSITKFIISIESRKQTDKVGDFFSSIMKNNPFYEYDYGRKKNNIRVISSNKYLQDQNSVVVINSTESKICSTESIAFHEFSTRAAPFVGSHQIFWRKGTQNDSWLSLHQNNTKFADTFQEIVHCRKKSYF